MRVSLIAIRSQAPRCLYSIQSETSNREEIRKRANHEISQTAIAISLATGCALAPLQAADVQIVAQNPVVELSVSEQINSAPDTARFSTGVESKARTATQALRLNSGKVRSLINQIRAMGIEAKDIQTSGISLNADYQYNRTTRQNDFVGYRVSNQVSVIVRDLDKLGRNSGQNCQCWRRNKHEWAIFLY